MVLTTLVRRSAACVSLAVAQALHTRCDRGVRFGVVADVQYCDIEDAPADHVAREGDVAMVDIDGYLRDENGNRAGELPIQGLSLIHISEPTRPY